MQVDETEKNKLKKAICNSFYQWIKLKLPVEVIAQLMQVNKGLLELVFNEMSNPTEDISQSERATDCIVQLVKITKKPGYHEKLTNLNQFILSKVQILS